MGIAASVVQFFELSGGMIRVALGAPEPWAHSIRKFEKADAVSPPPAGCIVFAGSSSFTLWSTLERDMAPLPAVNRGFGGALIGDVVRYAGRIVIPYRPSAVVLFAGTNDIAGPKPATPEYVAERFDAFVSQVHAALPRTLIIYVAITPTRARWKLWPLAQEANRLIEQHVRRDDRLHFIDLSPQLLGDDGLPIAKFYRRDGLHPSTRGYEIWTSVIKPALEKKDSMA
jgi:lysophospholipase L1-like esterase